MISTSRPQKENPRRTRRGFHCSDGGLAGCTQGFGAYRRYEREENAKTQRRRDAKVLAEWRASVFGYYPYSTKTKAGFDSGPSSKHSDVSESLYLR